MPLLPVCLALALCGGVFLALTAPVDPSAALALLASCAVCAIVGAFRGRPWMVLACALAGACAAGAALGAHADRHARAPQLPALLDQVHADGVVMLGGVLEGDASAGANGVRLRLAVHRFADSDVDGAEAAALTVSGTLAKQQMAHWRAGRAVQTPATLRRPAHYLNPGVPDDRLALARRGLTLVGSVKSATLVRIQAPGTWRHERAADLRAHVRAALAAHVLPRDPTAAAIATAILIGDRAGLDPLLEKRLQIAGTYHVIAISGGNIAVLTVILLGLTRLLRVPVWLGGPLVALLLVLHAGLVGGGASVARATTMAVIYLGLRALDQSAWSLNTLAAAVVGLVVARPLAVVDPGFVLSVGATAAIIVIAARVGSDRRGNAWRRAALGVAAASMATELVLLPVSATFFNRVTVAGLLLNLAAVPLMALVQVAASLTVLAHPAAPAAASACGAVAAWAAGGLAASAALVEWVPWLAVRTPAPAIWVAASYLCGLAAVVVGPHLRTLPGRWSRRLRRSSVGAATVCAVWILAAPSTWRWPWRADGRLRIVALDVGQGDATLVEFPNGDRWLVDAGGLPGSVALDIGERVVAPALWVRGTGRLDALVLTHGDPDHVGGAAAVIDDFAPAIFDGIPVPAHVPLATLRDHARARNRRWGRLARGDVWMVGGVRLHVWHPSAPDWERQRVRNDDSIVIELRYRDVSIVLPGDISAEVERALASEIPPAPHRVLKGAHHGSATSTSEDWLEALRPEVVVFSCGRENRYGHPAPAVLRRVLGRGADVFRTDEDGQVVVETDGATVRVSTFGGRAFPQPPRSGHSTNTTIAKARRREGAKDQED
ncbi:MAG: DNA internalization-related competence protein ComEC/Rec2 [Vicinamibacteria bacterium]|nr:DNA internalization-related competence protein ComEC/Rec2 [Vicinamibacteria bacterium]